jgi:dihydrofolate synthase/folylpolyglutamate synthase
VSVSLQHTLEALYGLERRRDKLNLDGTLSLMRALGDPHQRFRSVHVAGTNGKGSVCALVERVLREAGHRTGLFTSPHLVDFRERIRVNGHWADEAWLERRLEHLAGLSEGRDRTFFEVCTALAFDYFAEQKVEIAVVEVGLGGRLDCTNVLTPLVSVITTIGFDHTEILGDTLEKIAAEKAGIIKPGVPVVFGHGSPAAERVIDARAAEVGAPRVPSGFVVMTEFRTADGGTHAVPGRWTRTSEGEPLEGLIGHFVAGTPWGDRVPPPSGQVILTVNGNLALATLAALVQRGIDIPWAAVERGFERARWPGRLERSPTEPRLWWDGAHNVQGMMHLSRLASNLGGEGPPAAIVLALSRDKDVAGIAQALHGDLADATIVATRCRGERSLPPAAILEAARARGFAAVEAGDVPAAIRRALDLAGPRPVLLTGSLFAVGEAMEAFGGAPGEML